MNWIFKPRRSFGNFFRRSTFLSLFSLLFALNLSAAIQFDVFLGYDGFVPEGAWTPVVFELKNDGPTFRAVVEASPGAFSGGQPRRMIVELPTGSLKRVTIPIFSSAQTLSSWDFRLLDLRGKVLAEKINERPKRVVSRQTRLVGALSRTVSGQPIFSPLTNQPSEMLPATARFHQAALVPDNPIVLEGLDAFYLNSERASELSEAQVHALLAWLYAGGHLIVSVEQITDVNGVAWLRSIFPCQLDNVRTVARHPELQTWLRSKEGGDYPFDTLADDFNFENAPMQVAVGRIRDGRAIVSSEDTPLMITTERGRGRLTAILFSTEREPARSWKNISAFWTKLVEVPPKLYGKADYQRGGGSSADGIFGAMVDSKQVRKLPVAWLLLLLIVYLVVIGPLDQYGLKRLGKPMLTWITFPCYVVLFSFLIYFIGYKLRSGETEWNELHVVDVLASGEKAELRGRTFASIYSPVNEKYLVESQQPFATFRGEFAGAWRGGKEVEHASVQQRGDNFTAEMFVPVWTSQMFVSDWWQPGALPLKITLTPQGQGWLVKVENRLDRQITHAKLVAADHVFDLGQFSPKQTKAVALNQGAGEAMQTYLQRYGASFQDVVNSRQRSFGSAERGQIADAPNAAIAASFISRLDSQNNMRFLAPAGLDLSPLLERGHAIVFAWVRDYSPAPPINKFTARRNHRDTLLRVVVPVNSPTTL